MTIATATPTASAVVKALSTGKIDPGWFDDALIEVLEDATPDSTPLVDATFVTVNQWLVDDRGSIYGTLQLTKTDGSRIMRQVTITHNGTTGADATTTTCAATGTGTSADFDHSTPDWLDATLSGTGTAQVVALQVKAAANGSSWAATFYAGFLVAA